jgi:hypothetical protein
VAVGQFFHFAFSSMTEEFVLCGPDFDCDSCSLWSCTPALTLCSCCLCLLCLCCCSTNYVVADKRLPIKL